MERENAIQYTRFTGEELYTQMYNAEQEGAFVGYVRGQLCTSLDDFFREISASMRFPDYFGWNWAAFDECITDLDWLRFSSLLIVIEDFNLLFKRDRRKHAEKQLLEKYLNNAAEYWTSQNVPISILLNEQAKTHQNRLFRK